MARIEIVKLSGSGNDFVVIGPEAIGGVGPELATWIRHVCRRGLSVGADGVLLVEPLGGDRVRVRFHNPDGSVAFCGNGTRCAARFAAARGYARASMVLETAVGDVPARVRGSRVRLELPPPRDLGACSVDVATERLTGRRIEAGVPHYVVGVADLAGAPLGHWGPALRRHPAFGDPGTNVDVVSKDGAIVRLRTWERGVEGETLSCGTGAIAAAFAAALEDGIVSRTVVPRSGVPLAVEFPGGIDSPTATVLEGDARVVFRADLDEEATSGFEA